MLFTRDDDYDEDGAATYGELFIPPSTNQYTFLVVFDVQINNYRCIVTIFETDMIQEHDVYKTGDEVGSFYPDVYALVHVFDKYFFPDLVKAQYQFNHPDTYHDDIKAMAEVLEYARKRGLEELNK